MVHRASVDREQFNVELALPFGLRQIDFESAMRDVYDFFYDVNSLLIGKGLPRLEEMLRAAACSGMLSDMLTASLANHARSLTENTFHNGHPDLVVKGRFKGDGTQSGAPEDGIEVKTTRKKGGAVDMHGARDQTLAVFVYEVDSVTEPAAERRPLHFTEVYVGDVVVDDFRKNDRGELGTRTATLDADGIAKLRQSWLYREVRYEDEVDE